MQVSGLSGSSAALALRELFQQQKSTSQELPSARQEIPSDGGKAMQGFGGAQMSTDIMSSLMGLQMQPPSASDMAANLISNLDANSDGALSIDEVSATNSDAAQAFAALDSDGDGSLTSAELTSAFEEMGPPPGGPPPGGGMGGGPGGPPPSSGDMASSIISETDSDDDEALSLAEITEALGADESKETTSAFASLDTNADGKLSLAELTTALDQYLKVGAERFAAQAVDATSA